SGAIVIGKECVCFQYIVQGFGFGCEVLLLIVDNTSLMPECQIAIGDNLVDKAVHAFPGGGKEMNGSAFFKALGFVITAFTKGGYPNAVCGIVPKDVPDFFRSGMDMDGGLKVGHAKRFKVLYSDTIAC